MKVKTLVTIHFRRNSAKENKNSVAVQIAPRSHQVKAENVSLYV